MILLTYPATRRLPPHSVSPHARSFPSTTAVRVVLHARLHYAPLDLFRLVELGTDGRRQGVARHALGLCEGGADVGVLFIGPAHGQLARLGLDGSCQLLLARVSN